MFNFSMSVNPVLTDAQKALLKPVTRVFMIEAVIGFVSYAALGLYMFIGFRANRLDMRIVALWFGATAIAWRIFLELCFTRISRITGQVRDLGYWVSLAATLLSIVVMTFMFYGG
jgi:hypothetical protein